MARQVKRTLGSWEKFENKMEEKPEEGSHVEIDDDEYFQDNAPCISIDGHND